MVIKEYYDTRDDGTMLFRSYSDINHYIKQVETGIVYSEAIDVEGASFTYEETDEVIETENKEEVFN